MSSIRTVLALVTVAAALGACSTQRPAPSPTVWAPAPAPARPAPEPAPVGTPAQPSAVPGASQPQAAPYAGAVLGEEYAWLHQLFGPTPVGLVMGNDGSITLRVPMQHAFDAGANAPKPALRAVLGKLAESMTRQSHASLLTQVPGGGPRIAAIEAILSGQGVDAGRIEGQPAPAGAGDVVLKLVP